MDLIKCYELDRVHGQRCRDGQTVCALDAASGWRKGAEECRKTVGVVIYIKKKRLSMKTRRVEVVDRCDAEPGPGGTSFRESDSLRRCSMGPHTVGAEFYSDRLKILTALQSRVSLS